MKKHMDAFYRHLRVTPGRLGAKARMGIRARPVRRAPTAKPCLARRDRPARTVPPASRASRARWATTELPDPRATQAQEQRRSVYLKIGIFDSWLLYYIERTTCFLNQKSIYLELVIVIDTQPYIEACKLIPLNGFKFDRHAMKGFLYRQVKRQVVSIDNLGHY